MQDGFESTDGLTKLMFQMATDETMTTQQAAELLRENANIRTLREVFAPYAHIPAGNVKAMQTYLTDALMKHSPQGTARASVDRKVRMWMKDDAHSITKQGAVQLCFALGIPVESAGEFLCRSCGENFHWRDPYDIVYLFALREGMNYIDVVALMEELAGKNLLDGSKQTDAIFLTDLVRQDAEKLGNIAELESWLRESKDQLGTMHNTAYEFFCGYMELLANPATWNMADAGEKKTKKDRDIMLEATMSVREITDVYLFHKLVPRMKKIKDKDARERMLSAIERDVQRNWPDETTLSKMLNRKLDVSRKVLILLFLATDGDTLDDVAADSDWTAGFARTQDLDDDDALEQWRDGRKDDFEDLYARMNAMLSDCGFAQLDPRAPFDWMILYCMCGAESLTIDGRVQQFLSELFQGSEVQDESEATLNSES